ncbi:sulfotransferase domain-containing protein [Priestia aryabhattai]|uniref:sulfotransferase domain-containing protein n=1 Tax=Priestia aryabhattai TaxID=412384 RepID=UPI00203D8BED|nr:sulfotransferase domain-containing protein [Priestia aryabhattai]MCM3774136.1 sulfotransferase domain-containing protein [Priestia aryabhattai]
MPKILVNSVPKSGTNLLMQIIKGIPGIYNEQHISYDGHRFREILDIKPNQVVSAHTPYNLSFSKELKKHDIKQVFIYRDLRDVSVSLVHFINNKLPEHPLFPVFRNRLVTFEEQLNALILGIDFEGEEKNHQSGIQRYPGIYEEFRRIYEWRKDLTICSLRYEDLIGDEITKDRTLMRIIAYLWEDLDTLKIEKLELLNLIKNNIKPKDSWTFRKGKRGSWIEEFTESNKLNFKKMMGTFLIELGYEKDTNW